MPEEVRDAVFGNVGTTIAFRVGPLDAELLEKVFAPKFMVEDLVNLGRNQIYLSLMIDGIGSPPFSATTLAPIARSASSNKEAILDASRRTYSKGREGVEAVIRIWHETALNSPPGSPPPPRPAQGFSPRSAQSFPPRPTTPSNFGPSSAGLSSTSGAAKRRKKQ